MPPQPSTAGRFAASLGAGVHRAPPALAWWSLHAAMEGSGLATFVVDLRAAAGKAEIFDAFASGMAFPAWVGRNWDALDDALQDLGWLPCGGRGRALLVRGSEPPGADLQPEFDVLGDVLATAVASWAGTDTPLVVVTGA